MIEHTPDPDPDIDEQLRRPQPQLQVHRPFIVGFGVSAGGLEALIKLFESVTGLTGMAFVIVQQTPGDRDHRSLTSALLTRHTDMEVVQARHSVTPVADTVYVVEPEMSPTFKQGRLHVRPAQRVPGRLFLPIDAFFCSLAQERQNDCAVVVLSGIGGDGAAGVRAAKAAGAVTMCQRPDSARFDNMPRAALATGAVDFTLTPEHIVPRLMEACEGSHARALPCGEPVLEQILSALRTHTGSDFHDYKPATVVRRVERRMHELKISDAQDYVRRVRQNPHEASQLRRDLWFAVTRFSRDDAAIAALRAVTIPRLAQRAQTTRLRLWVAGCATGEDAYLLAMLLQDRLDALPEHRSFRLFATDIDPCAIERASSGEFSPDLLTQLPQSLRERHFTLRGDSYVVNKTLREKILFSRHDVIHDPPFSHVDMIACRDLLIHMKPAVQERVTRMLCGALTDGGLLWLGAAETLGDAADQFDAIDTRWRIYAARAGRDKRRQSSKPPVNQTPRSAQVARPPNTQELRPLLEALQESYVPPCLVVDTSFRLLYRFGDFDALLKLPSGPVSLDIRDLLPDELSIPLHALISGMRDGADVVYRELTVTTDTGPRGFDLRARSLALPEQDPLIALFFEGLNAASSGTTLTPEQTPDRVALLERELRKTRDRLQATLEELQASNEELRATNDELISANTALQSTNEELQGVNEELHNINGECTEKVEELTLLNDDMVQLFSSADVGILVLDDDLLIRRFNGCAAHYFDVSPEDLGRPLGQLSHRLQYASLLDDCAHALRDGAQPIVRRVRSAHDHDVHVQIRSHGSDPSADGSARRSMLITLTDLGLVDPGAAPLHRSELARSASR